MASNAFKRALIRVIGRERYVEHVGFWNDVYHGAFRPFRGTGAALIERHLIPHGGVVVDVGAHTGRFVRMAANRVGPSGSVFAFEPVSRTFRVLERTVALRRLHQVQIFNSALSDRSGTADITIPLKDGWRPQSPTAHLGGSGEPDENALTESVPLERLDDFCERVGVGAVDFLKCDTEGHESFVFKGGLAMLESSRPSIYVEIDDAWVVRQGLTPAVSFDLLRPMGYRSFLATEDGTLFETDGYDGAGDYFFLHPERIQGPVEELVA